MDMLSSSKHYEELYEQISIDNYLESLRDKSIGKYRTKTIISGEFLEVEIYPLPKQQRGLRSKAKKPSRKTQANLNHKNRRKRIIRTIHANFTDKDIWCTFTYNPENMPEDDEAAQRDMPNYIRRLKRSIKKSYIPDFELKYLYVTERVVNAKTGKVHAHHHIIMNYPDRDNAEAVWLKGRTQARRLQPDDRGLLDLAGYLAKEETKEGNRKGSKGYGYSLNLKKPIEKTADSKVKKRDVIKLAADQNEGKGFFEDLYASYYGGSYGFIDMEIKYSQFVAGAYVYVRMRRKYMAVSER